MTILNVIYASGGDVIIPTLELTCAAWDAPLLLCHGFEDQICTTEDGRTLTFLESAIDVALPAMDSRGAQNLNFAIDNVTGEAQRVIDQALEAEERVILTYREFLASDKSAPAAPPFVFTVLSGRMTGSSVQVTAGFFNAIGTAWPRKLYTTEFAPGVKYL
ncbi:MAG: DUF1833 family protein [Shewanella sp.]